MRVTTLCFLVKEDNNQIKEICLAMKKRGFGADRWNGTGGKVKHEEGESVEGAVIRETKEEISVEVGGLDKVAELSFFFPENKEWDQVVHVYFTKSWTGEPKESEEMRPKWFSVENIPYDSMWVDDIHWLPMVLDKKLLKAKFVFAEEGKSIASQNIKIIDKF